MSADTSSSLYHALVQKFNASPAAANGDCLIQMLSVDAFLVLRIQGKATSSQYQDLVLTAMEVVTGRHQKALIVDLTLCEVISSSAIGLIGFLMMNCARLKLPVYLVNRHETVRKSIRVMGLNKICTEADCVDDILDGRTIASVPSLQ